MKYVADKTKSRDVTIVNTDGHTTLLTPEKAEHIAYNGNKGFNWGNGSSESAKLALAILLDVTDDADFCKRVYPFFKREIIAHLPDPWEMEKADVENWIQNTKNTLAQGEPF